MGTPGSGPARAGPRVTPAGPRWGHREPACVLRVSSRPGRPPARRPLPFGGRHVARCPEAVADWPCDPGHRPGAREPQGARPQHMVATLSPASRSTVRTRSAVRQAGTVRRVRAGDTAAAQTPTRKEAGRRPLCTRGPSPHAARRGQVRTSGPAGVKSQPNGTAWEGTPGLVPQLAPALLTPAVSLPPASPWHTPDLADVCAPVGRRLPTSRWNINTIPNFLSGKHGCARVPASVTPAEVATGQKRGQLGRPRPTADSTSSGAGRSGRAHHRAVPSTRIQGPKHGSGASGRFKHCPPGAIDSAGLSGFS